jgi:hypothetical protein
MTDGCSSPPTPTFSYLTVLICHLIRLFSFPNLLHRSSQLLASYVFSSQITIQCIIRLPKIPTYKHTVFL